MLLHNRLENGKDTFISTLGSDAQTQFEIAQLIQGQYHHPNITVIGDMNLFKYEVLKELFGVQREMHDISISSQNFLEIAKASLSNNIIFNFNFLEYSRVVSESDQKLFNLVSSSSDLFLIILNAHEAKNSELYQTIEKIFNAKKDTVQKLRIVVIVRVPKNFSRFLEMQDQMLLRLKSIELQNSGAVNNYEGFFKAEIFTCPDFHEDRFWFEQKLQNVKKIFDTCLELPLSSSQLLQPKLVTSPVLVRTLVRGEENPLLRFSEIKKTSKFSHLERTPTPSYQARREYKNQGYDSEERTTMNLSYNSALNNASPLPRNDDPDNNISKNSIVIVHNSDLFEEVRRKVYRDALFELIEMRNKVKQMGVFPDFGSKGRIFYEKIINKFDFETITFRNMPSYLEKKQLFEEKIHNELHDMFELQISKLKIDVQNEFTNKLKTHHSETTTGTTQSELLGRYNYLSKFVDLEVDNLLDFASRKILELIVFPKEEDSRWSHEPILNDIKNELLIKRKETLQKALRALVEELESEEKNILRKMVGDGLSQESLKEGSMQRLINDCSSFIVQRKDLLQDVLRKNEEILKQDQNLQKQILKIQGEISSYFLFVLEEKISHFETIFVELFKRDFEKELELQKKLWSSPEAGAQLKALLDSVKHSKVNLLKALRQEALQNTPQTIAARYEIESLFTESRENKICLGLETEANKLFSDKMKLLNVKTKQRKMSQIKQELIFWVLWTLFCFVQFRFLQLPKLWIVLAAFFTLKIAEYIYRIKKPSPAKPKIMAPKKTKSGVGLIAKIKALFTKKNGKTKTAPPSGSDKKKVLKFTATKDFYKEKTS